MGAKIVALVSTGGTPYLGEQVHAVHGLARPPCQRSKQTELGRCKGNARSIPYHEMAFDIDREIAHTVRVSLTPTTRHNVLPAPAQRRPDPNREFTPGEWLCEHCVGPGVEAANHKIRVLAGADDHNGNSREHSETANSVDVAGVSDTDNHQGWGVATHEAGGSLKIRCGPSGEAALPELHVEPGSGGVGNV